MLRLVEGSLAFFAVAAERQRDARQNLREGLIGLVCCDDGVAQIAKPRRRPPLERCRDDERIRTRLELFRSQRRLRHAPARAADKVAARAFDRRFGERLELLQIARVAIVFAPKPGPERCVHDDEHAQVRNVRRECQIDRALQHRALCNTVPVNAMMACDDLVIDQGARGRRRHERAKACLERRHVDVQSAICAHRRPPKGHHRLREGVGRGARVRENVLCERLHVRKPPVPQVRVHETRRDAGEHRIRRGVTARSVYPLTLLDPA